MNRRRLGWIHRWLGVTLGVLPVVFGLTGTVLLYRAAVDAFVDPAVHVRTACAADEAWSKMADAATRALGHAPDAIEIVGAGQPGFIAYDPSNVFAGREAFVQPCDARVSGVRDRMRTVSGFALYVHDTLLTGNLGAVVVCVAGIAIFGFLLTGLALWPGWRNLRFGFSLRNTTRAYLRAYDLHKVAGIVSVAFLLTIALSGAAMSEYGPSKDLIARIFREPAEPQRSYADAHPSARAIDASIANAFARFPDGRLVYLSFPTTDDARFEVDLRRPFEDDQFGATIVHADGRTGRITDVTDSRHAPASYTIMKAMLPFHMGTFFGLDLRICYLAVGLGPSLLFATGIVVRLTRRRANRRASYARRVNDATWSLPPPRN